jgi:octanoyl-[GcvH]:protein N-octanoyltransferase
MMTRIVHLVRQGFPEHAELDTAVSRAILLRVAANELGETFRIHHPGPVVAFGRRDAIDAHFPEAVGAARREGFDAVERLAGGRAAVFHHGTLAFAWATPQTGPRLGITARFELVAGLMRDSLRALGADARVGEVPGEYCPGAHSVNLDGRRKVMGVGQRLVSHGAHVGGVVVVLGGAEIRRVLIPVYRALRLDWDPETAGDIETAIPGVTLDRVEQAILEQLSTQVELVDTDLDEATLALAKHLAPQHRPGAHSGGARLSASTTPEKA